MPAGEPAPPFAVRTDGAVYESSARKTILPPPPPPYPDFAPPLAVIVPPPLFITPALIFIVPPAPLPLTLLFPFAEIIPALVNVSDTLSKTAPPPAPLYPPEPR